jgi:hypothetical protein
MNLFADAASYLKDPLVLVGFVLFLALLTARQLLQSGVIHPPPNSSGARILRRTLSHGFVLGLLVLAIGVYLKSVGLGAITSAGAGAAVQSETGNIVREVDFGFVELNPGQPAAVPSYKYGRPMVLYSGEDFEYQAYSDDPIPPLELRVGDDVQLLTGSAGKIKIVGPLNQPLPAVLLARGSRHSLPGGAPPRISVKVQVLGVARPKQRPA